LYNFIGDKKMKDKGFIIKQMEYFADYRDREVFGMTPYEILEYKLFTLGYYHDQKGFEVPEDLFYCSYELIDQYMNKKGKVGYMRVYSPLEYYRACEDIKTEINISHIENGVRILSVTETYIDYLAKIEPEAVIYPNCFIEGDSFISAKSVIGPDSKIVSSKIGENTTVLKSVVLQSTIGKNCSIGPFAYIRPDTTVKDNVKAGTFVELKKTVIDDNTTIPHFVYAGDAEIGRHCNISCGVITANYDGKQKHKTKIGNNVFVGCNSTLVAPVELQDNTFVAAGSTVVEDVKSGSLAIARAQQVNKEGWMEKTGRMKKE